MNTNKGMDPMLSSFVTGGDSIWNTKIIADIDTPPLGHLFPLTPCGDPISPAPDSMLSSPEINGSSFSDLAVLWNSERKRVTSVKIEEDEGFSDVGSSEMDLDDDDVIKENISTVSDESVLDSGDDEVLCKSEPNNFVISSEAEARRYVEEKILQIAYVPNARFSHKEKIQYILSLSDCKEYSVEQIMNLDKKNSESARICAKIVQNIPQRYRWECVIPEQIPCCYTIVADCKKISCRDKPPRPMNAFMIWAQGSRRLINELCPKMQNAAISEALGYCWRQKPDSFKKRFEIEKIKLRRFHDYEFPAYKYKPKTKVQKAKEKEELSLSKAKLSKTAATKRKKSCDILPKETNGRRGRCGRPKKIKLSTENKDQSTLSKSQNHHQQQPHHHNHHQTQQHIQSEEPVKMSATKPAIKDMLTLKILNDRRSKEMAVISSPPRPPSAQDNIQHFLGQLSPTEVESPHASDIFEELRDLDSAGSMLRGKEGSHHHYTFPSSSVYDTPANTPPVDMEDHNTRLSPVQQLHKTLPATFSCVVPKHRKSSSSSVSSLSSLSPTHQNQNQALSRCGSSKNNTTANNSNIINSSSNNKCLLSPQASMPSLTAMLSSGPHIPIRNSHQTSLGLVNTSCSTALTPVHRSNNKTSPHTINSSNSRSRSRLSSTDVILSCVSEILDFPESKNLNKIHSNSPRDINNNSNNFFDFNNGNIRSWECFDSSPGNGPIPGLSGLNPKLSMFGSSKIFDFNDIDTLCPDLNVPLLSDDVMSSLMNTL